MMTNLVKRLITNLRYPLQVVDDAEPLSESDFQASPPLPWPDQDDILENWEDCEFLTGYDLYSLDDDNCSFHLFEEDDDFIEWYEEDVF